MRNDTQGLANLDLMGMIDMIYIGGNYALLHIKNKSCETLGLIFLSFPKLKPMEANDPPSCHTKGCHSLS